METQINQLAASDDFYDVLNRKIASANEKSVN